MKTNQSIHNLDSLEKEIYRLQLEASSKEKQLEQNAEWLRHNARQLFLDELLCRKRRNGQKEQEQANTNSRWNGFINKLADQLTDRAANGIDSLLDRFFQKKKKH